MISAPYRAPTCILACWLLLGPGAAAAVGSGAEHTSPGTDLSEVQREWAETVEALKSYSATQRDAAVSKAEQTLQAMDRRIEELEARTGRQWDELSDSAREARQATLRTLRAQRNQVAEWYGAMKHSSASAWGAVKQGFIESYGTLSDSFAKAWNEFDSDEQATP
jgi:TolA-binding protein